jgi:hypothetical protein
LARHGQRAPVNEAVVEFSRDIEAGRRTRGLHNLQPLLDRIAELA